MGEFSFAVLALAYSHNLIEAELNQILVTVVVVSLIFTSLAIRYVRPFSDLFFREGTEAMKEPIASAGINNHVVVCGYSLLGQKVVKQLNRKGITYIAIDHDQNNVKKGEAHGDSVIFGNAAQTVLNYVYVKNAIAVIIAIDNDEKVRLICESIRAIDEHVPIIVKISHQAQIDDLDDLGIKDYVNENISVSKLLVSKAIKCDLYAKK